MIAETLTALAEPNRFRIVELLRAGPQPVGVVGARLSLPQPQVSKHLKVLREAGLVDVEARAQQRLYQLRGAPLRALSLWLEDYRLLWDERFTGLDAVLVELQGAEAQQTQTKTQAKKTTKTQAKKMTTKKKKKTTKTKTTWKKGKHP